MGDAPPEITKTKKCASVRLPEVQQHLDERDGNDRQKVLGPMIEDLSFSLDRQNQRNLAEWAVKCAMCNDTVYIHPRFFTGRRMSRVQAETDDSRSNALFAAHFIGRSLDSNGVDFTLIEPETGERLARGHVYNVMVGHVVLQALSWRPEPKHKEKIIRMRAADGPSDKLTVQVWPVEEEVGELAPAGVVVHCGSRHPLRLLSGALQERERATSC